MKIYTGDTGTIKSQQKILDLDMGIMISSSPKQSMRKFHHKVSTALDNGAFSAWRKGFGFDEHMFLKTLSNCIWNNVELDFIVCPDIVTGGIESLSFSETWRQRLAGHNLYLAVQDGMEILDVSGLEKNYSGIFVGGSMDWKKKTGVSWVDFAHDNDLPCHIGRIGTLENLQWAEAIGADSVDSTSFVRNDSFDIVEHFLRQESLILKA